MIELRASAPGVLGKQHRKSRGILGDRKSSGSGAMTGGSTDEGSELLFPDDEFLGDFYDKLLA